MATAQKGRRRSGSWYVAASCILIALLCCLGACQSGSQRGQAAETGDALTANDANPMRAVTYSRQPMDGRQAVVERLLAEDPAGFWSDCASLTRQIDDWPMIRLLSDKAQASRDARALPWLVRSWAMRSVTVSDEQRPERAAIKAITGRPADVRLKSIVFDNHADFAPVTQVAAWSVLVRVESADALRRQIAAVPNEGQSLLVSMLKQAASAVEVLPSDRIAIARLMRLSVSHAEEQWRAWAQWREAHANDGPATLALRHLPALTHRDPQRDVWSRDRWLKHIQSRLANRRHATRGSSGAEDIVVKQRPDRLSDHAEALGIADLIVLDHLLDAMEDAGVRRAAFAQAQADQQDTTTELGGVLVWDDQGGLQLKAFAPLIRRHDQAYIATTRCIDAVYLGLAHYHFHTQRYDNADWAGPGKGDLDFADAHHANAIVLTYLDRDTLNVDAYLPGGIVIDLGCMTR